MRYLYLFIIAVVFSCKPQQELTIKEEKNSEVTVKTEQIKAPVLNDVLRISEVCDSVEIKVGGVIYKAPPKAKNFSREINLDSLRIALQMRDNVFEFQIDQKSRLISEKELIISKQSKEIERLERITKKRIAWTPLLIGSLILVLFIIFPGIPKFINNTIKRLILPIP